MSRIIARMMNMARRRASALPMGVPISSRESWRAFSYPAFCKNWRH